MTLPDPKEDGFTHINIYSKGQTPLGRILSNFSPFRFKCDDGVFASIEGYWYWLKCKDDTLRKLVGYRAKEFGKLKSEHGEKYTEEEFREKICKAIAIKMDTYKDMVVKSELPFTHYYVYGNTAKYAGYEWIVEFIEDYRRQLKMS
jgi:hypothetical protein